MLKRERFLRKKAKNAGYILSKGFVHYLYNNSVYKDNLGNRITGYELIDTSTGFSVYGSYDNCFDHLWSLDDAETFLKNIYLNANLNW